jgi:hypothetical protein
LNSIDVSQLITLQHSIPISQSLKNLCSCLSGLGRRDEADMISKEAAELSWGDE